MTEQTYYTEELTHWGILGMKWGIRRFQNKDGTLTEAGKKRYSEDYERSRSKSREEMTDDELKSAVNRLNNERQYEQYRKELDKKEEPEVKNPLTDGKKRNKTAEEHLNITKFKAKNLTTEELNKVIDRLQKEKQYKQLVEEAKSPVQREFQKYAKKIVSDLADYAVKELTVNIKDAISGEKAAAANAKVEKMKIDYGLDLIKKERERMNRDKSKRK